jgi:hypothetical protein
MGTWVIGQRQRRGAIRRSVRVDCEVVRERDFRLIGRRGIDLSDSGMLVLSETCGGSGAPRGWGSLRVLTGEEVVVTFKAPTTRLWFDCSATVARVVHGRRPEDWGACLGLSFEMDALTRAFLRAELRGFPPPLPAREPRVEYAVTARENTSAD